MTGQEPHSFGYQTQIYQGVWRKVLTFGAPRVWSHAWAAACLFVGLLMLTYWGFRWLPIPVFVWLLGHGALVMLTSWNAAWPDMIQAQWIRRYKGSYSAG